MTRTHTSVGPAEAAPDAQPVFVDHSGRRRRMFAIAGSAAAVVLLVALIMLGAGLFGVAPLRVPGFPDLGKANNGAAPSVTPGPEPITGGGGAGPARAEQGSTPSPTGSPTVAPSSPRHVPTQTPPHPTKTK